MTSDLSDLPLFASRPAFLSHGRLEDEFWHFHRHNPHVYALLVQLAREWKRNTGNKLGIKALFERVRWESGIQTTGNQEYKLCNNHTAFYARLIMAQEPDLRGLFNLREQRVKSSISPNQTRKQEPCN